MCAPCFRGGGVQVRASERAAAVFKRGAVYWVPNARLLAPRGANVGCDTASRRAMRLRVAVAAFLSKQRFGSFAQFACARPRGAVFFALPPRRSATTLSTPAQQQLHLTTAAHSRFLLCSAVWSKTCFNCPCGRRRNGIKPTTEPLEDASAPPATASHQPHTRGQHRANKIAQASACPATRGHERHASTAAVPAAGFNKKKGGVRCALFWAGQSAKRYTARPAAGGMRR